MTQPEERTRLTYVTDTYCVWCWAFGEALREFATKNAHRLTVEVLPAGMLVGERVQPVGEKVRVLETAERVTELTGAQFGEGFRAAVRDGRTVLDGSLAHSAPVCALDHPGRTLILLSRHYGTAPRPDSSRVYLAPSSPVPVSKWDYTSPQLLQQTYDLGRRDAEAFVAVQ